ncbi:hypothetical protein BJF83_09955 [Nocardiopsis sp. CNR-923]|nr:hypothetical protein BJF83_09955 [Nocardiopsis sp. CNR-923]
MDHDSPKDHHRTETERLEADAAWLEDALQLLSAEGSATAFEALQVSYGIRFLTVTHPNAEPSAALRAWRAVCSLLSAREHLVVRALAPDQDIFLIPPPKADELVSLLACIARAVSAGEWEIVEGYRPLPADEA